VLCQIMSSPYGDLAAVPLNASDFASGGLLVASFAGHVFEAVTGACVSFAQDLGEAVVGDFVDDGAVGLRGAGDLIGKIESSSYLLSQP